MMKNVRILALSIAVAAGSLAVVGCSGATATEQPASSANALSKAPVGVNTHGMVKVVGDALGDVALRPDQRVELEKLASDAEARHLAQAAGRKELMTALADQIESGTLDKAALQPKVDRVAADLEKSRPDDQAAMLRVHALLDPDQRNAFVDALQARMKGKHREGQKGMHEGFGRMRQLADDLKLTDDQRAQIKDVMKSARENGGGPQMRQVRERFNAGKHSLESFRTEKFEPAADLAGKQVDLRAKAQEGTTRMIGFAEKILPILTPEQRKIAADKIREVAANGGQSPLLH
jgi:Spy/CpxP family protein refolding chaperone